MKKTIVVRWVAGRKRSYRAFLKDGVKREWLGGYGPTPAAAVGELVYYNAELLGLVVRLDRRFVRFECEACGAELLYEDVLKKSAVKAARAAGWSVGKALNYCRSCRPDRKGKVRS